MFLHDEFDLLNQRPTPSPNTIAKPTSMKRRRARNFRIDVKYSNQANAWLGRLNSAIITTRNKVTVVKSAKSRQSESWLQRPTPNCFVDSILSPIVDHNREKCRFCGDDCSPVQPHRKSTGKSECRINESISIIDVITRRRKGNRHLAHGLQDSKHAGADHGEG